MVSLRVRSTRRREKTKTQTLTSNCRRRSEVKTVYRIFAERQIGSRWSHIGMYSYSDGKATRAQAQSLLERRSR